MTDFEDILSKHRYCFFKDHKCLTVPKKTDRKMAKKI